MQSVSEIVTSAAVVAEARFIAFYSFIKENDVHVVLSLSDRLLIISKNHFLTVLVSFSINFVYKLQ